MDNKNWTLACLKYEFLQNKIDLAKKNTESRSCLLLFNFSEILKKLDYKLNCVSVTNIIGHYYNLYRKTYGNKVYVLLYTDDPEHTGLYHRFVRSNLIIANLDYIFSIDYSLIPQSGQSVNGEDSNIRMAYMMNINYEMITRLSYSLKVNDESQNLIIPSMVLFIGFHDDEYYGHIFNHMIPVYTYSYADSSFNKLVSLPMLFDHGLSIFSKICHRYKTFKYKDLNMYVSYKIDNKIAKEEGLRYKGTEIDMAFEKVSSRLESFGPMIKMNVKYNFSFELSKRNKKELDFDNFEGEDYKGQIQFKQILG